MPYISKPLAHDARYLVFVEGRSYGEIIYDERDGWHWFNSGTQVAIGHEPGARKRAYDRVGEATHVQESDISLMAWSGIPSRD